MGLFSGLEKMGLGKLDKLEVFEEDSKKNAAKPGQPGTAATQKHKVTEEDLLFDKSYTCPVCDNEFHSKMIRTGKVKLLSADTDLRPKYQLVDSLKYDALVCPECGYASLSRFFKFMMPAQAKLIRENISKNFSGLPKTGSTYTYDDAILRHQLALANAIVKKAKNSEKAYTCLKMAWLYRGKAETLPKETKDYDKTIKELKKEETELLSKAYDGFMTAFSRESFPMCGMDEMTVTFLVAELARRTGKYEESGRWISKVLTSRSANERIKNKARDIKELLNEDKKKAGIS
ncbi:MAG: DUF2225 domain-containing protein [Lachnospiraceae bacterium]|jgi:uncharacterized protein (DUF2225 family)|uniref:DUF2225 domain-containing protein n=1 Tax=Clostridium sp. AF34-13 TaxID=2293012 RepID=UPI001FA9C8B4|nr:DUF2225 domain-containing protein [Clostridium sp. AF34-13]UYJ39881.1 MAG: DUF2225 domain-containing protein [Lachnospiraceae bacterium]